MSNIQVDNINESITDLKRTISNEIDDQEIPPAIEDIIEQLIQGLRDKAITIRYLSSYNFFLFIKNYIN